MKLQALIDRGEELKETRYDSPIIPLWKEDVGAEVRKYGAAAEQSLQWAMEFKQIVGSGEHGQHMHVEMIDKVNELLGELKNRQTVKPKNESEGYSFWDLIHKEIEAVAKSRFESAHYADSVEAAFKHLNSTVKDIVRKKAGSEFDGADLMDRAFSIDKPIIALDDLSTESGRNIQKGYLLIFKGAMIGIRNPKTHGNLEITRQNAVNLLFIASHLYFMIDEAK